MTGTATCTRRRRARTVCGSRAAHRSRDTALLLGGQLQDVIDKQPRMVFIVALERGRCRSGKDPVPILALEESGWHRSARADGLRIDHPLLHPIGLQAPARLQKIGRGSSPIMRGIAGGMTLQA